MSNINCGIGVLHVKRQILTCDVISLFAQVFIVQLIGHTKRCLQKILNFLWLSFCDMTVPSKNNIPSL